jgi:hypothetical protein
MDNTQTQKVERNLIGLSPVDYKGKPSTLCPGVVITPSLTKFRRLFTS